MSRIPIATLDELTPEQHDAYQNAPGCRNNLFLLLAHSRSLSPSFSQAVKAMMTEISLPPLERHICVLAVLHLDRGAYEWAQHMEVSKALGISPEKIEAIADDRFGDNIMAALPDVIANTVGNLVAERIARGGSNEPFDLLSQVPGGVNGIGSGGPAIGVSFGAASDLSPEAAIRAQQAKYAAMSPEEKAAYRAAVEGPRGPAGSGGGVSSLDGQAVAGNAAYNATQYSSSDPTALSLLGFFNSERIQSMDSINAADISGELYNLYGPYQNAEIGDAAAFADSFAQGTQFMRDAALPYLQMGAQYEIESGNPSGLANTVLQAVESYGPREGMHWESMRLPDYYSFSASTGVYSAKSLVGHFGMLRSDPATIALAHFIPSSLSVGFGGNVTIDRYGNVYGGLSGSGGYGRGFGKYGLGGNATMNWLNGPARPSARQLNGFLTGPGDGMTASYGAAFSGSRGSDGTSATGIGIGTPELSISRGNAWEILYNNKK